MRSPKRAKASAIDGRLRVNMMMGVYRKVRDYAFGLPSYSERPVCCSRHMEFFLPRKSRVFLLSYRAGLQIHVAPRGLVGIGNPPMPLAPSPRDKGHTVCSEAGRTADKKKSGVFRLPRAVSCSVPYRFYFIPATVWSAVGFRRGLVYFNMSGAGGGEKERGSTVVPNYLPA